MRLKQITTVLIVCSLVALSGCQTKKPKTVQVTPPPPPPEKLVVHQLNTYVQGKRNHVTATVDFSNKTGRPLDYVMFKTRAFNNEGVEIPALKSGQPNAWLRIAGPIDHEERTGENGWNKVWASADISCFRIEGAEVIFDDSSVEFYEMDQIELALTTLQPAVCQPIEERVAAND